MANEKLLIDLWSVNMNEVDTSDCTDVEDILSAVATYLSELPTVDAAPVVHGQWLPEMEEFDDDPAVGIRGGVYQTGWKCSICGRFEPETEPYCNCGAKMDGGNADGICKKG
jgi:hypothetical protein